MKSGRWGQLQDSELCQFAPSPCLSRRLSSVLFFLRPGFTYMLLPCVATMHPLFTPTPTPIRTLNRQRERDCGKNSPVGVCQLGAGFEAVGRKEGLALECEEK